MNYAAWHQVERLAKIEKLLMILVGFVGLNPGFWMTWVVSHAS